MLFIALHLHKIISITVRLPDNDNKLIHLIAVHPKDIFSFSYRHSVEKTLVKGIFQVASTPAMLAVETRMTSVGTGLPNTFSKRTTREGKWIVVDEENKKIDSFRFFISRVNTPFLSTPKGMIDLNLLPSGTIILLGVEKISQLRYLIYKCEKFLKKNLI